MPEDTADAVALATELAEAADDRKAADLVILEVAEVLGVVDCFLLATAGSERQLDAVADSIEERARTAHHRKPVRREGRRDSGWLLLDYGDVVCHLFLPEQREFYSLERLWADVPRIDVPAGQPTAAGDGRAGDGERA